MPNPDGTPTPHEKARHEHNHPDKHYGSYCINPHSTSLPTIHSNPFLVSLHISAEINSHYAGDSESDDEAKERFKEQFDEATKTIVDRLKPDRVVDAHSKDDMIKAVADDGDWVLTPRSRPHNYPNTALFNTSSGHSAGGNDGEETGRDNNETENQGGDKVDANHTQRRKVCNCLLWFN